MGEKDGRIRMEKKAKKKICILYTGGTVGMVPTALGYAPKTNYFSQKLREIPQIRADAMPLYDIVEFDPLLDSSNVGPEQWYQIGSAVQARYRDYDGFVVLHGTDSLYGFGAFFYAGRAGKAGNIDRIADTALRDPQRCGGQSCELALPCGGRKSSGSLHLFRQ